MDVKLEKWFRPNIDKEVLRELTKKSDIKGLIHVSIYFSLLSIVGYLAYITWGTWLSVFWFYVYGNIFCFCNPIWHETGHKTAFKTNILNENAFQSRPLWVPMNKLPMFSKDIFVTNSSVTDNLYEECLSIPCSTDIINKDLDNIING